MKRLYVLFVFISLLTAHHVTRVFTTTKDINDNDEFCLVDSENEEWD